MSYIPYPVALRRSSDEDLYAPLTIFNPVTQHLNLGNWILFYYHSYGARRQFLGGPNPPSISSPLSYNQNNTLARAICFLDFRCLAKLIIRVRVNACSRELFVGIITRIVRANNSRECVTALSVNTVHWFDASCSLILLNNSITLISPVQSLAGLHFLPLTVYA